MEQKVLEKNKYGPERIRQFKIKCGLERLRQSEIKYGPERVRKNIKY